MLPACVADLVGVVGELDAAGLAAAADLHLGLDDDRVAGLVRPASTASSTVSAGAARLTRDVVAGEVLLALVLEEIHVVVTRFLDGSKWRASVGFAFVERLLEPEADRLERRARAEDLGHTLLAQHGGVGVGDDAAAEHEHVAEVTLRSSSITRGNSVR